MKKSIETVISRNRNLILILTFISGLGLLGVVARPSSAGEFSIFDSVKQFFGVQVGVIGPQTDDSVARPLNSAPQPIPFNFSLTDPGLITSNDNWSTVPGIEGYFLRNDGVATTGVDPRTILGDTFGAGTTTVELDLVANQPRDASNTATFGGIAEFHPDAMGNPFNFPIVGLQPDNTADATFLIVNLNTTGRQNIHFQFAAYDIDCSSDDAITPLATQFRVGSTGNFTMVAGPGAFSADVTAPNLCNLINIDGGDLPAIANDQPLVQIRIITTNAAGADEWIGIDFMEATGTASQATPTPTPTPTATPTPTRTPTPTPTPQPPPIISINDVTQVEGNFGTSTFTFVVSRSGSLAGASSATFATFNGTATGGITTAPPVDYLMTSGTVSFAPGQDSAPILVTVVGDVRFELDETFTVQLADPMGAILGDSSGLGTIINDDSVIINEVDSDNAGTDTSEFVELYATLSPQSGVPLDGLVVVFYDGATDTSYEAFDLDGRVTNASGYFTLGSANVPGVDIILPSETIQNGADAVALYVGNASDFPSGTSVRLINLRDALVYDTSDADDPGLLALLNTVQPQIDENATNSSATLSMQRCPNASGGERNTTSYRTEIPTPDTFNTGLAPLYSITGRVLTPSGIGIRNAIVSLTDA